MKTVKRMGGCAQRKNRMIGRALSWCRDLFWGAGRPAQLSDELGAAIDASGNGMRCSKVSGNRVAVARAGWA